MARARVEHFASQRTRYGIIFYNDHHSEAFLRALNLIIPKETLKAWYKQYSDIYKNLDQDSSCDYDDISNDLGYTSRAGMDLDSVNDENGRYSNSFGIIIGPYSTFFIKIPGEVFFRDPDATDKEVILCYANSKNYQLPVAELIFSGQWVHHFEEDGFINDKNKAMAFHAYKSLECYPRMLLVNNDWNNPPYQKQIFGDMPKAKGWEWRVINEYESFSMFLHDKKHFTKSCNTELLRRFWYEWRGVPMTPYESKKKKQKVY